MNLIQLDIVQLHHLVTRPMNGDYVVLQHLDITLDCRSLEHDNIVVE
jgi:hypothetical protein